MSAQIREIFAENTSLIEPLSLDEAFLDVREPAEYPDRHRYRQCDQDEDQDVTGLNWSAGISYNKFLAKMASGYRKPNNFFVILPGKGAAFVASLPIEKFHGVGPATATRMHALGISTGANLAALPLEEMTAKFERSAHYWFDLSRGIDDRQVQPNRERKSIGAEDTFREDITTIEEARTMTVPLIEKVWTVCQNRNLYGRTVTLKVKFSDFEEITRARSRPAALASLVEFSATVDELLALTFPLPKPVRLLGVTISNFDRDHADKQQQMILPIGVTQRGGGSLT